MYGDLDTPRRRLPVPRRAVRRAGARGRLPARPRAPVPGGVRRRARGVPLGARPRRRARRRPGRGSPSAATRPAATSPRRSRSRPRGRAAAGLPAAGLPGDRRRSRDTASAELFAEGFYLTKAFMDLADRCYASERATDLRDPRLSPLHADLPPGWRRRTSSPPGSTRCATRARPTPGGSPTPAWTCELRRFERPDPRVLQHRRRGPRHRPPTPRSRPPCVQPWTPTTRRGPSHSDGALKDTRPRHPARRISDDHERIRSTVGSGADPVSDGLSRTDWGIRS